MTHDDWKDSLPEPWRTRQKKWDRGALIHRAHEEAGLTYRQIGKILNRGAERVNQIHHGFLRHLRHFGPMSPAERYCQAGPFVLPLVHHIRKIIDYDPQDL